MSEEKFNAKRDQVSGKIKETVGHLTDDKSLEAEGKAEHTKGKIAEVIDEAKDSIQGFVDHLSGKDKKE
ncbi:UNVERIFIED_CONTAM: CsbD family protein [Streptococcus canis]|uniref:CsbD family protein n=1 Tax=Streptococcus canis TaxID=1329 RepID=A0AAE4Q2U7_STRCB|nr:CsbD family protein [Streptococcus canis]MDV5975954.1 CsbD family protein [Streptococcus canis]MDW7796916.1 CsbD family protein [Streptococcus canis]MDW7797972.1 CsbD family protein [Streptococcus canis]QJD12339.1 CsbD family protein [Streptococcus canis]QKG75558.1 CsbD family protein [Streptococcus canis]